MKKLIINFLIIAVFIVLIVGAIIGLSNLRKVDAPAEAVEEPEPVVEAEPEEPAEEPEEESTGNGDLDAFLKGLN